MAKPKIELNRQIATIGGNGKPVLKKPPKMLGLYTPKPEDNPLAGLEVSDDIETACGQETSAVLAGFKARAKAEQERFQLATDSEFWFAIAFQSRDQKEAFLDALGWLEFGDKYLDGPQLAEMLGISLPPVDLRQPRAAAGRLVSLAQDLGRQILKRR